MTINYFSHSSQYIDETNTIFSGIAYVPNFLFYSNEFKVTTIDSSEEYRPDKIASRLWNDGDLSWVLDIINEFQNGISEYTAGRKIYYLETSKLSSLGVL